MDIPEPFKSEMDRYHRDTKTLWKDLRSLYARCGYHVKGQRADVDAIKEIKNVNEMVEMAEVISRSNVVIPTTLKDICHSIVRDRTSVQGFHQSMIGKGCSIEEYKSHLFFLKAVRQVRDVLTAGDSSMQRSRSSAKSRRQARQQSLHKLEVDDLSDPSAVDLDKLGLEDVGSLDDQVNAYRSYKMATSNMHSFALLADEHVATSDKEEAKGPEDVSSIRRVATDTDAQARDSGKSSTSSSRVASPHSGSECGTDGTSRTNATSECMHNLGETIRDLEDAAKGTTGPRTLDDTSNQHSTKSDNIPLKSPAPQMADDLQEVERTRQYLRDVWLRYHLKPNGVMLASLITDIACRLIHEVSQRIESFMDIYENRKSTDKQPLVQDLRQTMLDLFKNEPQRDPHNGRLSWGFYYVGYLLDQDYELPTCEKLVPAVSLLLDLLVSSLSRAMKSNAALQEQEWFLEDYSTSSLRAIIRLKHGRPTDTQQFDHILPPVFAIQALVDALKVTGVDPIVTHGFYERAKNASSRLPGIFDCLHARSELHREETVRVVHLQEVINQHILRDAKDSKVTAGPTHDDLRANPILSGLVEFHVKRRFHTASIAWADMSTIPMAVIYLYSFLRCAKLVEPWPDMDVLIDLDSQDWMRARKQYRGTVRGDSKEDPRDTLSDYLELICVRPKKMEKRMFDLRLSDSYYEYSEQRPRELIPVSAELSTAFDKLYCSNVSETEWTKSLQAIVQDLHANADADTRVPLVDIQDETSLVRTLQLFENAFMNELPVLLFPIADLTCVSINVVHDLQRKIKLPHFPSWATYATELDVGGSLHFIGYILMNVWLTTSRKKPLADNEVLKEVAKVWSEHSEVMKDSFGE